MELSNYLVSWVVAYLGDSQPIYIGFIIYIFTKYHGHPSIYNNKSMFFFAHLVGEISAGEYRQCVASSLRWAAVSEGGWPKDAPENTGKLGGIWGSWTKTPSFTYQKMTNKHDFPSNHHVLRSERKKSEKKNNSEFGRLRSPPKFQEWHPSSSPQKRWTGRHKSPLTTLSNCQTFFTFNVSAQVVSEGTTHDPRHVWSNFYSDRKRPSFWAPEKVAFWFGEIPGTF